MGDSVDISPGKEGDGGVLKQVIKSGIADGCTPSPGDEVTIHYEGRLLNGTKFVSSRDNGDQLTFKLNDNKVVKGLDLGISTMNRGEVCKLTCQPDYAYGSKGLPPDVPPNSTLVFEVELLNWKGEDLTVTKDGGILRSILVNGEGSSMPHLFGSTVHVHIKGIYEGRVFEDRELDFDIGYGSERGVVKGLERAVQKFKAGEESVLVLSSKYAFGEKGSEAFGIPPNVEVQYKVRLIAFLKAKEHWELTAAEKIEKAERLKSRGTFSYKADEIFGALKYYTKAKDTLDDTPGYSAQEITSRTSLLLLLYLNCSMCQIKLEQWNGAIDSCNQALEIESHNEKALFRKAQAFMGKKDYEEAINNFEKVKCFHPFNKSAQSGINTAKQRALKDKLRIKDKYKGMFEKFAEKDAQKEALDKARGAMSDEPIGYWSNDMAAGMMSLQQEMEAFGEKMPEKSRRSSGASSDGSPRHS